jgi:hypothetical protein
VGRMEERLRYLLEKELEKEHLVGRKEFGNL